MSDLIISLLGPFRASFSDRPAVSFESNKVRALLAYLATEAERPHSRDELASVLWPDQPDQAARNNLRQALANLRQAIGDRTAQPPFLLITRETVQFNTDSAHRLDVSAFTALLDANERHTHRRAETCQACHQRLEQAVALYRGNFLEPFSVSDSETFEEWALVRRERLRQMALDALYHLTDYRLRHGAYDQAQRHAARQLTLDPWREEAHRQAMRALALSGQRSAALRQYETCRDILARELDAQPSEETTALFERIRDGKEVAIGMADAALPLPPTPLVGRESELVELDQLVANPACRLITIVGPGGIGKTRLVLQVASAHADAFAGAVHFVPLASVASAEFLAPAIAAALQLRLDGQSSPSDELRNHLRGAKHDMLIVLDSFEHLMDAAGLLADIVRAAPRITLLVTSREPLDLQGEWVFDVEGLAYPSDETDPDIEAYGAVQLFVQRARQLQRRFAFAGDERRAVARICRLVKGMPLAIEMAAAWIRIHTCRQIAGEIEASLRFLTTHVRDVPERHRSMWATFEHSWQLLHEDERQAFSQLSVFRGTFEEAAAAHVTAAASPTLAALVDKSLLRRVAAGAFEMHDLARQYADEKLRESGAVDEAHHRHLAWFVGLAQEAEPHLTGKEQAAWLDRLETVNDDLRAALSWSLDRGEIASAAQLSTAMWRFWWTRGHLREGRQWFERVLARSDSLPGTLHAQILNRAAVLAAQQGDFAQAKTLFEANLALNRKLGDVSGVANALNNLGAMAIEQADYARARGFLEESLPLRRQLGNKGGVAATLNNLGAVAHKQSDADQARAFFEESLALYREMEDARSIAGTLNNLGAIALERKDATRARMLFGESLSLRRSIGDKGGVAECLEGLMAVAVLEERFEMAARVYGVAAALRDAIGAPLPPTNQDTNEAYANITRARLGDRAFDAACSEGRVMALDQTITEALRADPSAP